MDDPQYYPGLEGVIAGKTAISTIDGGLQYRGYAIEELAEQTTFLEVAYLLLQGELPDQEHLADFRSILIESAEVAPSYMQFLETIPFHANPMDVLRTGVSSIAHFEPFMDGDSTDNSLNIAGRMLSQIPVLIAARHRQSRGLPVVSPNPEYSFAGNLLWMITGEPPSDLHERAMDVSLILYAEHEFNASTFTARVVTSTLSDMYSAITAAIGALKGPLHGGANERVLAVLEEVGSPDNAEAWLRSALERKQRVMGFGHRVYKTGDPRARLLKNFCRQLAEKQGDLSLEKTADTIEQIILEEKGLHPNLDWPSARLYHYMGLDVDLYTPLFVASRVAGWCAHVIEQASANRLIRPRSSYNGVARRAVVPLDKR